VVLVSGDAYVDHPAFGVPLLGRVLEAAGFRVGIVAQPDWRDPSLTDFRACGRPRLFFGVSSGNMDSMVNHYTAHRRRRSDDAYTPGGEAGRRPDRATTVYANRCRAAFPDVPVVVGGVEASLRRLAHYDYWDDRVRRSLLMDAKEADLLVFGFGERPLVCIARHLAAGGALRDLRELPGIAFRVSGSALQAFLDSHPFAARGVVRLPSFEDISHDKSKYAEFSRLYHLEHNPDNARLLVQPHGDQAVVANPPGAPPTTQELDAAHELPFTRRPHPRYAGACIPAWEQIRFSLTVVRGCPAGCSFCCITEHQGRDLASRSQASVLREIEALRDVPGWTGVVSDLGGPTANLWGMGCDSEEAHRVCRRASCLFPTRCPRFRVDHGPLVQLMKATRGADGVKRVFVASGVRYDAVYEDRAHGAEYLRELVTHHVGGHLKIAPEHVNEGVLKAMRKPGPELFERFLADFQRISREAGREQYLVPYFISSHPGCGLAEMRELADFLKRHRWKPQQVQDFTPTPMTLATDMYWTGVHPNTGKPLPVARTDAEKRAQREMLGPLDPPPRRRIAPPPRSKRTPMEPGAEAPGHASAIESGAPAPPRTTRRVKAPRRGRRS